jgi:hypothetical protein
MPWEQAPALYAKLLTSDNPQAHALRFLLLCCTPRTDEILGALWSETEGCTPPSVGNRLDRNWTKLREPQAHFTILGPPAGLLQLYLP